MLLKLRTTLFVGTLMMSSIAHAGVIDDLLKTYQAAGATDFSSERGAKLWKETHAVKNETRSCTSCHTDNLKQSGKHVTTGKVIEPMAPSVNSKRLTEAKTIEKWLKRNCEWVMDRVCTAQEKADVLTFLRNQ